MNIEHYRYIIEWSVNDEVYVGRVAEFPSLTAHGVTQEKALREIKQVTKFVVDDMTANKEPVPEPLSSRKFSGKLVLRLPEYLHRRLAVEAAQQGISLNQLLNLKLESGLL